MRKDDESDEWEGRGVEKKVICGRRGEFFGMDSEGIDRDTISESWTQQRAVVIRVVGIIEKRKGTLELVTS